MDVLGWLHKKKQNSGTGDNTINMKYIKIIVTSCTLNWYFPTCYVPNWCIFGCHVPKICIFQLHDIRNNNIRVQEITMQILSTSEYSKRHVPKYCFSRHLMYLIDAFFGCHVSKKCIFGRHVPKSCIFHYRMSCI